MDKGGRGEGRERGGKGEGREMGVREIGTEEEREGRWEWGGERDRRRGRGV